MTDTQKIKLIREITSNYFEYGTNEKNKGAFIEGLLQGIHTIANFEENKNDT